MKKFVRDILPMWAYRRLGRLYSYFLALREGSRFVLRLAFGKGEMCHRFRTVAHPFVFPINEENRKVVLGNFIRQEVLAGPLPAEAGFIVDAGGYIGDSAALFLSRYPLAQCVVLEPGLAHAWAEKNLKPYGARAMLRKAALMSGPGSFQVLEAETGSRLVQAEAGDVEIMTMNDLLKLSPSGMIDLLKIDIEGAELDLFKGPCDWLRSVGCVTIELHGQAAMKEIPEMLLKHGFKLSVHGSLTVAVRKAD